MLNKEIKKIINRAIKDLCQSIEVPDFVVEWPQDKNFGDYASNIAMILAKKLNKNPMEIAEMIKDKIEENLKNSENEDMFSEITIAKPGFINFKISDYYLRRNLCDILKGNIEPIFSNYGKGQTVVIDYSAPNIAKPMHIGHLRSTIIGQALYNIYKALGYKVIGDNHIGDWGTQFGKLIYSYKNWGNKKEINKDPIQEMTKLYVKFHKESEKNKNLEELARKETKKLQDKDAENIKIWKFLVRESLKDFKKIYKILNIKFDHTLGESFYDNLLAKIVKEGLNKKIASKSEGAIIIDLTKYNLPPFLIKKTDGAYLYTTTDLATMAYREKKFKPDKILYVVANEQALHFQQLFVSAKEYGLCKNIKLEHIKFGMVLGKNGKKFSTRKGETVELKSLISESIKLSQKIVEEKNPELSKKEKKRISRIVGLGAIKYNDLSQNRMTDIAFDWDKMLSFDGNSAPYLQYTCARINSLRRKYNKLYKFNSVNVFDKPDFSLLKEDIEKDIMRQLIKFPEAIESVARENSPHLVALYIYELASLYNSFYSSTPIIKSEKQVAKARIYLSKSVAITIKNGLSLLGIDTLKKM